MRSTHRWLAGAMTALTRALGRVGRLPGRARGPLALCALLVPIGALVVWTLARGAPAQSEGESIYEQIHRLRTVDHDYAAARALAQDFLATHPELDTLRQLVHYEYAATLYSESQLADALASFQQLVADYSSVPVDVAAPDCRMDDALFMAGVVQTMLKQYGQAGQTFAAVADQWPQSNRAVDAAQHAIRALIHEELNDWSTQGGVPGPCQIDHAAEIEARVAALVGAHPDSPACPAALLDLLNYHQKRAWCNGAAAAEFQGKVEWIAGWMQQVAPQAVETSRAALSLAGVLLPDDPEQALALILAARQKAVSEGDGELYNDAEFARASLLHRLGNHVAAREVWATLLEREQAVEFEAHVRLCIGFTHLCTKEYDAALAIFAALADERYPGHVRATALVHEATTLRRLGLKDEALAAVAQVAAEYPGEISAGTARFLQRVWARGR